MPGLIDATLSEEKNGKLWQFHGLLVKFALFVPVFLNSTKINRISHYFKVNIIKRENFVKKHRIDFDSFYCGKFLAAPCVSK